MAAPRERKKAARNAGSTSARWVRENLLASALVLGGLIALLVLAFSGASQQTIAWSGLVVGVFVGVVIAAASRGDGG